MNAHDMSKLSTKFYKSESEDRTANEKNLKLGTLQVTGKNLDRLIFNYQEELQKRAERDYSFLLLVCKVIDKPSRKGCNQAKKFVEFLRSHYTEDQSHFKVGVMNHEYNEHPIIENLELENFPVLIFFGRNDKDDQGKVFHGTFAIQKILDWLNKKLLPNEKGEIILDDEQYQELLLLMAKNKRERKKLEKLIKKAKKEKENQPLEQMGMDAGL